MAEQPAQYRRMTLPRPPSFDTLDKDPAVIPSDAESTSGLAHAFVDSRRNKMAVEAMEKGVAPPETEMRGATVVGTPRGMSKEVMARYEAWRSRMASASAPPFRSAPEPERTVVVQPIQELPPAPLHATRSRADEFLSGKTRVTIEMSDGIFAMPAISVRQSTYCVMVLVPLSESVPIFVPRPGTELTLAHGDDRLRAYFPGAFVEYPELGCAAMAFIKAES